MSDKVWLEKEKRQLEDVLELFRVAWPDLNTLDRIVKLGLASVEEDREVMLTLASDFVCFLARESRIDAAKRVMEYINSPMLLPKQ